MSERAAAQQNFNQQQCGFTLLELLLVLAIMAIVSIIAYPNLTTVVDNLRLRNDALLLAQEMRTARTEAVMSQVVRDIRFYPNSNYYQITPSNRVIYLSQGIRIQDTTFPEDPYFFVDRCRFHINGSPEQGGHVRLTSSQGRNKYIIVNPIVCRIRVSDYPPD
jgi:prepilin-type N-terminal cleavage/methylation domain-containing protein